MAALQKIRNHAALLITIVAVALAAFVVGDALTSTSSIVGNSRNNVGSVNGKSISFQEFQAKEKSFSDAIKERYQRANQTAPSDAEIRNFVWEKFLNSSLISNEMEEVGMTVTEKEIYDATRSGAYPMLRQIPLFYNENGQYDINRVQQFFAFIDKPYSEDEQEAAAQDQNRQYWAYWEDQISQQMAQEKLLSIVLSAVSTPNTIVDIVNKNQSELKDVIVLKKNFSEQELTSDITDEDIKSKYEQVKDEKFKTKGYRSVKLAIFNVSPSEKDYADTKDVAEEIRESLKTANQEEVRSLFAEASSQEYPFSNVYRSESSLNRLFSDFALSAAKDSVSPIQFVGGHFVMAKQMGAVKIVPDSANISLIVIADQNKDVLSSRADSVLAVLKSGSKFEDVAQSVSLDPQSAARGGEIGWIQEGSQFAVTDFDDKVFAAKKGDVLVFDTDGNPVKFIVKVNDLTKPVKKANVAVLGIKLEPSSATDKDVYQIANRFCVDNKSLQSFEAAADSQGIQLRQVPEMDKNQSEIYVVPNGREIVKWAWNKETSLNDVSSVFSFQDMYVVAALYDAVEEDEMYKPLTNESVRSEVELLAKNAARAKIIVADMNNADVNTTDTLKGIGMNSNYVVSVGNEPEIVGAISSTPVGSETKPLVGSNGVYKFKVIAANPVEGMSVNVETLDRKAMSQVYSGLFKSMQDAADVTDNRANFY